MTALTSALGGWFIAPLAAAFAAVLPIIILLYLLKLRRTEVVISSTMLWMKALQDVTANAPFQKLRRNLLLLLQLLAAAALVLALMRPFLEAEGISGQDICVMIDVSASMGAAEPDGGIRLDRAKEEVLRLIDGMERGDRMMLVTFAARAAVLSELTSERLRLRRLVRELEPVPAGSYLRDAMMVASSLRGGQAEAATPPMLETVVISDGNIADLEDLGATAWNMTYVRVGETRDNLGIVAFDTRRNPGRATEQQAFVRVHNSAAGAKSATLTLSHLEGPGETAPAVLAVEQLDAPPGQDTDIAFEMPPIESGILQVSLGHDDALPADNSAWLALRPPEDVDVLLVSAADSPAGYFLSRAFASERRVELTTVAPAFYTPDSRADLIVFVDYAPDQLPDAAMLFVNAAPPLPGLAFGEPLASPPVIAWDSAHPLMRFLNPEPLRISTARKMTLPPDARAVLSTSDGALIADVSREGRPIAVIAFDIADSNWPWQLSFPLFVQNLNAWLPGERVEQAAWTAAGRPFTLPRPEEAGAMSVRTPAGSTVTVEASPGRDVLFAETAMPGAYWAMLPGEPLPYAVNLLDANESALGPSDTLAVGREGLAAPAEPVRERREYWRWLVAVAIAILAIEWWVYAKRAWM